MKLITVTLFIFLLSGCIHLQSNDKYVFDDGEIWIEAVIREAFGSKVEKARKTFHERALAACAPNGYTEVEVKEWVDRQIVYGLAGGSGVSEIVTAYKHGFIRCSDAEGQHAHNKSSRRDAIAPPL